MDATGNVAAAPNQDLDTSRLKSKQWVISIGLFLLLGFSWLPNSYSYMVGWPYILIWQVAFLSLAGYTVWLCRKFSVPFYRLGYGLDYVILLTVLVSAISTIASPFRAVACWNLLLIVNYIVLLYCLVNALRNGSLNQYKLWGALAIAGTITSCVGLALWRPNSSMWLSNDFGTAIRNAQPLGHHNFVGGYELLLFPIVASFSLSQAGWRKWVGISFSTIVAIALYVSGSRGALAGFLVLGLSAIVLGVFSSSAGQRRRWGLVALCFSVIMSMALLSNPRVRTLFSASTPARENVAAVEAISDGPVKDRLFMLQSTYNILKERPLFGVGPGNLSRVYNTFRPIEAGTGLNLVQQVHNTPAQLAAELGLFGLAIYAALLGVLARLGYALHKKIETHSDRLLLYGIVGSWLGYAISSLSDYQLENVGISSALVITTALLISLADAYKVPAVVLSISTRLRRSISLCLLCLICANLQLWARVDTALLLAHLAIKDATASNLVEADEKLLKASYLTPWDPTYPALAAEIVLELIASSPSQEDVQSLRELASDYFHSTVNSAPNDPWFNQNLATLLIEQGNSKEAEPYIKKAIQLLPRNSNNYTYYTLGLSLLAQSRTSEAIEAFSLEGLSNPIFLTTSVWQQPLLKPLKEPVLSKTLSHYQTILSNTYENSKQYRWLYEQWAILSWWHESPIPAQARQKLRPLAQAIIVSEEDPDEALRLLDEHISAQGKRSNDLFLLQARLSPEKYLEGLLNTIGVTPEEENHLRESINGHKTMKDWLSEVSAPVKGQSRNASVFAYRNLAANTLSRILYPGNIDTDVLPTSIGLFTDAPREYPQLDYFMKTVRESQLSID